MIYIKYYHQPNTKTRIFATHINKIYYHEYNSEHTGKMSNYRWTICAMLFFATTVNYLDRQVLSLTWDEFIKPEFHWDESHYGTITAVFSFVYAACMLFAGRFVDWLGSKKDIYGLSASGL